MQGYTVEQFKEELQAGAFTFPGGYPKYLITADSEALSFKAAQDNKSLICDAIEQIDNTGGWLVVACEINWEDEELRCAHSNELIPSAYGGDS